MSQEKPLAVGDRVMPGPKWFWGDQGHKDGKPLFGTVVHIGKHDFRWGTCDSKVVYVLWDTDIPVFCCEGGLYSNSYQMGEQGVVKARQAPEYSAVRLTPLEPQSLKHMEYDVDYDATSVVELKTPTEREQSILKFIKSLTGAHLFDAPPKQVPRILLFDAPPKQVPRILTDGEISWFSVDSIDFSIDLPKEPTEGERLAKFFATSEHDRVRTKEDFDVTGVWWSDASEPRNDLRDVLMIESATSPCRYSRLRDALATEVYRREEDKRAAEQREALAVIRDDFDNLPDA